MFAIFSFIIPLVPLVSCLFSWVVLLWFVLFFTFFFFLFFNVVLSLLSSHPFLCWFIMMSIKETCSGEAEVVSPLFFFFSKTPVCVIIKKEKSPSELSVTHFSNVYLQIHTHSFMGFPYFYSLIII